MKRAVETNTGADLPLYLVDADLERLTVGTALMDETAFGRMAALVTPEDFALRKHQVIWLAMSQLSAAGEPIDRVTLYNQLQRNGEIGEVGGLAGINELDTGLPKLLHPESYAKAVRRKLQERRIWQVFGNISREAELGVEKPGELLRRVVEAVEEIRSMDLSFAPESAGDFNPSELLVAPRGVVNYPFDCVQQKTGGMRRGEVILLAARPSIGKSTFALNVGLYAARSNKRVGIFSREMSKDELRKRLLAHMTQTNLFDIIRGELNPQEIAQMERAAKELRELPLFLDDRSKTVAQIRRQVEAGRYELVVIDYLGLLTSPGRHENRNAEMSVISRDVKLMAMELNIPVLALHQLSRKTEERQDKHPELPDLRDSGSLEQDADVVAFLYRDWYYKRTDKRTDPSLRDQADLLIKKQRNGPVSDIPLDFYAEFVTFADRSPAR